MEHRCLIASYCGQWCAEFCLTTPLQLLNVELRLGGLPKSLPSFALRPHPFLYVPGRPVPRHVCPFDHVRTFFKPKAIYLCYVFYITFYMLDFEILIPYNCLYFLLIFVNSMLMAVLAETCCSLYDK